MVYRSVRTFLHIWVTISLGVVAAFAQQDFRFINYTKKDGLHCAQVNCLLQDRVGYIWIGTRDGLFRFDGNSFKAYYHNDADSGSIAHNNIQCLFEDSRGDIWVGTIEGVSCFDPVPGLFTNYSHNESDTGSLGASRVNAIIEDLMGFIWITTEWWGGSVINRFNPESKTFTRIRSPKKKKPQGAGFALAMDKQGLFYVSSHDGVFRFNPYDFRFEDEIDSLLVTDIFTETDGKAWLGFYHDKYIGEYDANTKKYIRHSSAGMGFSCRAFAVKSAGELWIADEVIGLGYFNKRTKSCTFIQHEDKPYSVMEGNGATCMLKDRSGTLWIGFNNGLSKLDPRHHLLAWNVALENGKSGSKKSVFYEKFITDPLSGDTYISGGYGIHVTGKGHSPYMIPIPDMIDAILDMAFDKNGDLWVVNWHYLFKFDRKTKTFKLIPVPIDLERAGKLPFFVSIYADKEGKLWLGTLFRGLLYYDPHSGKSRHFIKTNRSDFIIDDCIMIAGEDSKGNLWLYSHKGFCMYKKAEDKFIGFRNSEANISDAFLNDCRALVIADNDEIWLGYDQKGICRYVPSTGIFTRFTTADGLCNDEVNSMAEDNRGNIWVGTGNGLSCFDQGSKTFTNYYEDDGLASSDVNATNFINGVLYIGQTGGYCTLSPDHLGKNQWIPPVVINSFKIFGKEYPFQKDSAEDQTLKLSYKQNHFSFDFAALNFTSSHKNQFAYMLEGFDKDWIYAGTRRYAAYTDVPGGKYTFRVKASNNDGLWNETGTSLSLEIIPPFWETWWFRILCAILIPSGLFFWVNRRIQSIKKKEEEKSRLQMQLAGLEMKALRAQMNPHFIFNALNSIQQQIISADTANAFIYLDKFARLLRMILDNSEHNFISLKDELTSLQLYIEIESLRFQHSFNYSIIVSEHVNQESVLLPGMLLQPYVENAIWHGLFSKEGQRTITIKINVDDGILYCSIEDNGIGREKAQSREKPHSHKSRGMMITAERLNVIEILEKKNSKLTIIDLKDVEGNALGTRVELAIPVIEEHKKHLV